MQLELLPHWLHRPVNQPETWMLTGFKKCSYSKKPTLDEFPAQELEKIDDIQKFMAGDIFGGYVRYRYDELDEYTYPYIPIFSRAYIHSGVEEDFDSAITALNKEYSNYKYDQTQNTYYYKINNQIISINHFVTDLNEQVVSLSIQIGEN